jgi:hypothetical protein
MQLLQVLILILILCSTLHGKIISNIIMALLTIQHKPTDWIPCLHKYPAKTSTSIKSAREPFGDQPTKELPIP